MLVYPIAVRIYPRYVYAVGHVKHPKKTTLPGGWKWTQGMNKADIPLDPAKRWEWIKYQLRANGTSLAKLARKLDVSGPAVKNTKRTPYPRMERAIATTLGLEPVDLWPERWDANGNPHRLRPKRPEAMATSTQKHNPAYDLGHRKTGTEA